MCMDTREKIEESRAEHVIGLKILMDKLASNSNKVFSLILFTSIS